MKEGRKEGRKEKGWRRKVQVTVEPLGESTTDRSMAPVNRKLASKKEEAKCPEQIQGHLVLQL